MIHRPRTFTFYSYKGGVGRSMALLNVAYTLHSLGRHVLIVDLDLEAPGVSGFLRRQEELVPASEDQPDVVDLLSALDPAIQWELSSEARPEIPKLEPYLHAVRTDIDKYAPAQNPRFRRTRLDVLCASDERDYANRLEALHISRLTAAQLEQAGNLLREVFFQHRFPWNWMEGEEDQPTFYDYILIDSRTGFNETSGLCIGPLADRLLIFCGLNDQNINGTAEFLRVVGLTPEPRREKWDDADDPTDSSRAPSLGQKPSLLIASPVPYGEMEEKARRFKIMEQRLHIAPAASISYHPRLSVIETIFCRDGRDELITREYRGIAMRVLAMVGDHQGQWRSHFISGGPPDKQTAPTTGELCRYAALLDGEDVAQLASMHGFAAVQLSQRALKAIGAEADALFKAAAEKYQAALAIKPDFHEALNKWGNALSDQAKQKSGAEADALFSAAEEKYRAALAINPNDHEALTNWGDALSDQAKQKSGAEADALFSTAEEKFRAALAIKPNDQNTLHNWGVALSDQAKQKSGAEADALFKAAGEKYQAALAIKPDFHEALKTGASLFPIRQSKRAERKPTPCLRPPGRNTRLPSPSSRTTTKRSATGAPLFPIRQSKRAERKPTACSQLRVRNSCHHLNWLRVIVPRCITSHVSRHCWKMCLPASHGSNGPQMLASRLAVPNWMRTRTLTKCAKRRSSGVFEMV